jgi:prepilin-type N-terminal cleavage/methylation domain-containing protein
MSARFLRTARQNRGFTLLEIAIALVVMVVGITGIVALFPAAIKSGNQTVVDSYASQITQSVIDGINVGIREARYRTTDAPVEQWDYFIFAHDGALDDIDAGGIIPERYDTVFNKDFCVLLPRGPLNNRTGLQEPILHFPCPNDKISGRRSPQIVANNPINDSPVNGLRNAIGSDTKVEETRRVFRLGRRLEGTDVVIREEFLGEGIGLSTDPGNRLLKDPYPQYSFSFTIKRARIDTTNVAGTGAPDGRLTATDAFSDNLFEVRVKVFRNFNDQGITADQNGSIPTSNLPVREFVTLISK